MFILTACASVTLLSCWYNNEGHDFIKHPPTHTSCRFSSSRNLTFTFLQNLNRLSHLQSQTLSHRAPEVTDHCGNKEGKKQGEKVRAQRYVMTLFNSIKVRVWFLNFKKETASFLTWHFIECSCAIILSTDHKHHDCQNRESHLFFSIYVTACQSRDSSMRLFHHSLTEHILSAPCTRQSRVNKPHDCTGAPREQQTSELGVRLLSLFVTVCRREM